MAGLFNIDIGSIIKGVGSVADDLFTSDEERLKCALRDKEIDAGLVQGQLSINKEEARHKSVFVAGWRPAIGWVGAVALGYQFIIYPVLTWVWSWAQAKGMVPANLTPPPELSTGALLSVISGMLGIAGMRSYDKKMGISTDRIKK